MTAEVVHANPSRDLTLSEAPERTHARDGGQLSTVRAQSAGNITPTDTLAAAIAAHLSPRAGTSIVGWDRPAALATRTAFLAQAIEAAARCPLCASDVAAARRG